MNGYYGYHNQPDPLTPFEKCRQLLITLHLEQKKEAPNTDVLTALRADFNAYKIETRLAAFDAVCDNQGWSADEPTIIV